jgi:hypothetical protein
MSHSGNEQLKEDAFEDLKQQYIDAGYTEKQAEELVLKYSKEYPDFWIKEEAYNYNSQWRS